MKNRLWSPKNEIDGEAEQLVYLVDNGWAWQWPGWQWVADRLNAEYHNNRTAATCRRKYVRLSA